MGANLDRQRQAGERERLTQSVALDDMKFKLPRIVFADRPAARRLARLVDRLAASRDQIMPVGQRLAFAAQAIGAGRRQPVELVELGRVELHAIGDLRLRLRIIGAAAVAPVEQFAGDVGRVELAGLLILELVQAAAAAAVAQRFPLAAVELAKGFSQKAFALFMSRPAMVGYGGAIKAIEQRCERHGDSDDGGTDS